MILLTADYHIKLGQKNVPKDWAIARYKSLFDQINAIDVETHIIMGDLFDRTPTMDELELYFAFIAAINVETIIFDGNHCATRKGKTFLSRLAAVSNAINPLVQIVTDTEEFEFGTILPYCELHKKDAFKGLSTDKPLFTHVRGEIPPHVKPEIDLELFDPFPIVFAGDLHAHSNTQRNIVYPGSPLTTSFHREEVDTGYLFIDDLDWSWHEFKVPQLIRKTVTDPLDMIPTTYHHTIYELEGDLAELADVRNSDLLDKKVVKRSAETSLFLDKSMTITEELSEYLLYILELPEEKVSDIIGTFRDNIKNS